MKIFGGNMRILSIACAVSLALCSLNTTAFAFNQPPLNLSATTFLDGGAPPGHYYLNYTIFTEGQSVDKDGKKIPGDAHVNVIAQLHQYYFLSNKQVLGGNFGIDLIMPLVSPSAKGSFYGVVPVTANTAGLGDLVVGPAIQWDKGTLMGKPLFQRFEFCVTFPTGKYDKNKSVSPGSNLTTINPYYSFVWMFHPRWDASLRLWYAHHSENDETKVKPGQAIHFNYAFSRQMTPKLRLGVAGYILQQISEDEVNGVKQTDSKERVMAMGPGFVYMGKGLTVFLSHPIEFGVRNRFKGSRTTLQLIHRF